MSWLGFSGKIDCGAFLFRFCFCVVAAGGLFSYAINEPQTPELWGWCAAVAGVLLWILMAAVVQRLHDWDTSGWYAFFMFIPFLNLALLLGLMIVKGGFPKEPAPTQKREYEHAIDESFVPPEDYPEQTDESFDPRLTRADMPPGGSWRYGAGARSNPMYHVPPIPVPPEPEPEIDDDVYRKMGLKPPKKRKP